MRSFAALGVLAVVLVAPAASAEVVRSEPGAFIIKQEVTAEAKPDRVWHALGDIDRWWHSAHTYSRDSSRLQLDLHAGACFCERWGDGSIEHARVILAMTDGEGVRTLRMEGGLGPLQEIGVTAVLTWTITPTDEGSKVTVDYRVAGDPSLGLADAAGDVDFVIGQQVQRFKRFVETGAPE